ncbi:hypothetical protein [Diadegma fenestrale ichnovirus]|nr:hypothetical protein [Diadegma fenestrale ichnovirus]
MSLATCMLSLETWCKSWLYSKLDSCCWHSTRVWLDLCQCIESSLVNIVHRKCTLRWQRGVNLILGEHLRHV